jgi:preprotein translocase subunit SecD
VLSARQVATALALLAALAAPGCGRDTTDRFEYVYRASAGPNATVSPETLKQTARLLEERAESTRAESFDVRVEPPDRIRVSGNADHAHNVPPVIGAPGRLAFYDWEPNVIAKPNPAGPQATETPFPSLYKAALFVSGQRAECIRCTTSGPSFYVFEQDGGKAIAGPDPSAGGAWAEALRHASSKNATKVRIPQGRILLEEPSPPDRPGSYILRDRPALAGVHAANPIVTADPITDDSTVSFEFSEAGRSAFQALTRRVARRSGHFAIALDGTIVSRPRLDLDSSPGGLDGRNGTQITGDFNLREIEHLVWSLETGPLPLRLSLESEEVDQG